MENRYRFTDRPGYFQELIDFARGAGPGDRIAVATMSFHPEEPVIDELTLELTNAARHGAHVALLADAINFTRSVHPSKPGPLWYGAELTARSPRPFGGRFATLETLQAAGGTYVITNRPTRRFTIPQVGRSHIKYAVLNNRIYIGGNNLDKYRTMDVMVSWDDPATADYIYNFAADVTQTASPRITLKERDVQRQIDGDTTLLIDAGVPRQSRILDAALQLIDEAQERIFMTCQYFPGGRTGQHLAAAMRRGVDVTLYYSPPSVHGLQTPGHYLYELHERGHNPAGLFKHRLPAGYPKLHAKVLVTEKGAMLGSHNYVVQGVRLGTAEIALCSRNKDFGTELEKAITRTIQKTLGE
ncbi:MAG TPA: phospholipase D-like domain-containing protein [Candidatus Saccharimonadales bacterium]|jgi:phosphatidylserine/phosphatidylglycerophosphate/cardiolipin synthase-like enzyme